MNHFVKNPFSAILFLALIILFAQQCKQVQKPVNEDLVSVKKGILQTNAQFDSQIKNMLKDAENNADAEVLKKSFDQLRFTYKKMEWAVEYFLPNSARFINGPALPEIEFAESTVLEPEGLQVLEELIYEYQPENRSEIIRQLKLLQSKSGNIKTNFEAISVNRAQVFDALRNEVFRISSLGISGFDTPISGRHLLEMPVALQSINENLKLLATKNSQILSVISEKINAATSKLSKNPDKNTFDYADFLSKDLNEISASLLDFKKEQNIADVEITSALKKNAATFYAKNAFDVNAFVPGEKFNFSVEKATLGKQLFNDPVLSRDNNRSCATCHIAEKAFTDGRAKSASLENADLPRNTPSLNYSALQHGQFWDMRNEDLEGQSSDVITNKDEMHGDLAEIVAKLNRQEAYKNAFATIYKTPKIEQWQLQNALASYVRSLAKFSSPFDDFMRGNFAALTENQKQGFNLFVGKANCASCHFLPLFNGTVPPDFAKTEQEILGTAKDFHNKNLDGDRGRGRFHETVTFLQHSFKTPTLRNIAKTAPYMHNGGYQTLQQVMDFYNRGSGKGLGFKVDNQTLSDAPLNLTQPEIAKIIDFMEALSDR